MVGCGHNYRQTGKMQWTAFRKGMYRKGNANILGKIRKDRAEGSIVNGMWHLVFRDVGRSLRNFCLHNTSHHITSLLNKFVRITINQTESLERVLFTIIPNTPLSNFHSAERSRGSLSQHRLKIDLDSSHQFHLLRWSYLRIFRKPELLVQKVSNPQLYSSRL